MVRTSDLVYGFCFFQVKMFTGSVGVLLTSASLKLKSNYQELGYTIHLMSDPEGNSFVFPRVLMFPETKSRETSGLEGKQN